jgi:hypothetical protein
MHEQENPRKSKASRREEADMTATTLLVKDEHSRMAEFTEYTATHLLKDQQINSVCS